MIREFSLENLKPFAEEQRAECVYQDKCKELGIDIKMVTTTDKGGMILAADEGEVRSLQVIVGTESGQSKVQVMYGLKK